MKTYFRTNTLEGAWIKAVNTVLRYGIEISEDDSFKEISNLHFSYTNAFETQAKTYELLYGDKYFEYMKCVYSTGGDKATGRNYHKLIYDNHNINQVDEVIKLLKKFPHSRSAIIILASPDQDKKPCVLQISFNVRENHLNMCVQFKSSDLIKKFIPDLFEISKIHAEISQSLNIPRGKVDINILCAQIYVKDINHFTNNTKKISNSQVYKTNKIVENWDKEASLWDNNLQNPQHYVNYENGYARFLNFMKDNIPDTQQDSKKNALDSGCGTGVVSDLLKTKKYKVYATDISPQMLRHAHKNGTTYILANSLDLPYKDNFFSIICSRGVLISHVGKKYVDRFLNEHNRVLKTKGLFMFDFITHFNKNESKKKKNKAYFSIDKVIKLIEQHGFKFISKSGETNNRVNAILCQKI